MSNSSYNSKKKTATPSNSKKTNQMKYEIASEFGVNLGADATARQNGSVGGEITRRLVKLAKNNMADTDYEE